MKHHVMLDIDGTLLLITLMTQMSLLPVNRQ